MKKKFLGLISMLFAILIIYVWINNDLKNYLAPQMQIYIKVAVFPLIIMSLVSLFSESEYKFKITDLILLLPIIMIILAGNGRITSTIASNRTMTSKVKRNAIKVENKEEKKEIKEEEKTIMNIEEEDTKYMDLSDFITYSPKALKLEGSNITVKGFALLGESYVPDGYFVLGKYGISCCTADAMFTGFIVKTNTDIISNDSWFEINGKLVKGKDKEGYDILYIEPSEVKRINENSEESYVYPCYSYGDDNCQKLMKYGFGL